MPLKLISKENNQQNLNSPLFRLGIAEAWRRFFFCCDYVLHLGSIYAWSFRMQREIAVKKISQVRHKSGDTTQIAT